MMRISPYVRDGFKTSTDAPSNDAICVLLFRNRDVTYRAAENKSVAELYVEINKHIATYERERRIFAEQHPRIFDDGNRLWYMNDIGMCADNGGEFNCFGPMILITESAVHNNAGKRENS